MMYSAFGSMMPFFATGFMNMIAMRNRNVNPSSALNKRSVNGSDVFLRLGFDPNKATINDSLRLSDLV